MARGVDGITDGDGHALDAVDADDRYADGDASAAVRRAIRKSATVALAVSDAPSSSIERSA